MTGFPIGKETDDNVGWFSNSDESTIEIYADNNGSGSFLLVEVVTIKGTGRNPFGIGSNC
jgi:hypothetical protein